MSTNVVWSFQFYVGVCSDGTAAVTGKHSGIGTQIKEVATECKSTHFFLNWESLAMTKKKVS